MSELRPSSVARGAPGCTCGTPPFAPPEPSADCPFHGSASEPSKCDMHAATDCGKCYDDSINAEWFGRSGSGFPVVLRVDGGWVTIAYATEVNGDRIERILPLNPLYARRLAAGLISAAETAENNHRRATP